jgi:hypothetical protein
MGQVAMDEGTPANRATEYRNMADMMRLLAQQMRFPESRERLLMLADSFDQLGEREVQEPADIAAD